MLSLVKSLFIGTMLFFYSFIFVVIPVQKILIICHYKWFNTSYSCFLATYSRQCMTDKKINSLATM